MHAAHYRKFYYLSLLQFCPVTDGANIRLDQSIPQGRQQFGRPDPKNRVLTAIAGGNGDD